MSLCKQKKVLSQESRAEVVHAINSPGRSRYYHLDSIILSTIWRRLARFTGRPAALLPGNSFGYSLNRGLDGPHRPSLTSDNKNIVSMPSIIKIRAFEISMCVSFTVNKHQHCSSYDTAVNTSNTCFDDAEKNDILKSIFITDYTG